MHRVASNNLEIVSVSMMSLPMVSRHLSPRKLIRLRHKETNHVEQDNTGTHVGDHRHHDERSRFGWPLRSRAIWHAWRSRLIVIIICDGNRRANRNGSPFLPLSSCSCRQTFTGRLVDLTSDEKTTMETSPGRLVSSSGGGGPREDNAALPTACLHLTEAEFAF